MSAVRMAIAGRDTCTGRCETALGCNCKGGLTELELDAGIAERRAFVHQAEADIESRAYRSGWRWGVLDGAVVGGVLVALAFIFGINGFKG